MANQVEQLGIDFSNFNHPEAIQTVEKKGDHVITKGATLYLDEGSQICWIASGTAYCKRLDKNKESAVVLNESLRIYRDGQRKIIPTGQRIWVARLGLVRS